MKIPEIHSQATHIENIEPFVDYWCTGYYKNDEGKIVIVEPFTIKKQWNSVLITNLDKYKDSVEYYNASNLIKSKSRNIVCFTTALSAYDWVDFTKLIINQN